MVFNGACPGIGFGKRRQLHRTKRTTQRQTPYPWGSSWGVITHGPRVRYGYRIATADGEIQGHAYGDIINSEGQLDAIVGKFYELPPVKLKHGKMEFRRMINSSDIGWSH